MFGFDRQEMKLLRALNSPSRIQDYLETIKINFADTCLSPRRVIREKKAHCLEGAMMAAAALLIHGERPLLLDLRAVKRDDDHVVALFRQDNHWGAISKTNHAVLRYREPVYKNIRELVMSYFHEYFLNNGKKTLREYSQPIDLTRFLKRGWLTSKDDLWYISEYLDAVPHKKILNSSSIAKLRRADPIEIKAGKIVQWKRRA
ncbi:hypothetical protein A3I40_03640 [Candidatus Uhrbacteria bacterium RIFCSPLOWO2_02_FULL_48_12]|uniref:Transglutaminase-like domain-containing protein n=1 Tax=Candidatus Uhrbacteria bacterium RIFCSPLOWO2_02_FULL_48_12 TaxID=1802407 RepID=A0A1F7V9U9_9BACT|nr:MAG: hypothetical protein A3I40_03640 [Candidatus Uhrbacteria bacterium RIFCSPLOWO2_02_FULL_48_12]